MISRETTMRNVTINTTFFDGSAEAREVLCYCEDKNGDPLTKVMYAERLLPEDKCCWFIKCDETRIGGEVISLHVIVSDDVASEVVPYLKELYYLLSC